MSYGVVMSPGALEDLDKFPLPLQQWVEAEIRRLAAAPVQISVPSRFPYLPGQCLRIETRFDEHTWSATILFRYTQDESYIEILGIPSSRV